MASSECGYIRPSVPVTAPAQEQRYSLELLWVAAVLVPNVGFLSVSGLFPNDLAILTTLAGIIECVAAVLAGAAVYKEGVEAPRTMAARV